MSCCADKVSDRSIPTLAIWSLGAAVLFAGCLQPPRGTETARPKQVKKVAPRLSPEMVAEEAAQSLSQLGAQVLRNSAGDVSSVVLTDLPVNDVALVQLRELSELEVLSLSGTQITDSALPPLTGLERLTYLFMNDTDITDQGLLALADSAALRYISLDNTQVTSQAVEEFRKLSPGTVVQHSPRNSDFRKPASGNSPNWGNSAEDGEWELLRRGQVAGTHAAESGRTPIAQRGAQLNNASPASNVRLRYRNGDATPSSTAAE